MFWDRVAGIYDLFGNVYNGKVDRELCRVVASQIGPGDNVLECACGTGMISVHIARKCRHCTNVEVRHSDILALDFLDKSFDAVVAAVRKIV